LAVKAAKAEPPRQIEMTKPGINMTIPLTDPFTVSFNLSQLGGGESTEKGLANLMEARQ
jgi:hypothetical protein